MSKVIMKLPFQLTHFGLALIFQYVNCDNQLNYSETFPNFDSDQLLITSVLIVSIIYQKEKAAAF